MALANPPFVSEATSNYVSLEWMHEVTNGSDAVLYVVALLRPSNQTGTLNELIPLSAVGYLSFLMVCVGGRGRGGGWLLHTYV